MTRVGLALLFLLLTKSQAFDIHRNQQSTISCCKKAIASIGGACLVFGNCAPTVADSSGFSGALADVGVGQYLVKDGRQLLRLSLPVGKDMVMGKQARSTPSQQAQEAIELVRLRIEETGFTNPAALPNAKVDLEKLMMLLTGPKSDATFINTAISADKARVYRDTVLLPLVEKCNQAVKDKKIEDIMKYQEEAAQALGNLRAMELPPRSLPYSIPSEYDSLPRLMGRAKIEMKLQSKHGGFKDENGKQFESTNVILEVDGYHAPLTAGNIVDLTMKKFYDNMDIQRAEELIVQTGSSVKDKDVGYIDPATKEVRTIPLEVFYKNDKEPVYGITSDDDNRAKETKALPFQAFGALGMAREEDPDSASSQFFFLKWLQALVAPGRNTLDGYYSSFGYVIENEDILNQLKVGDKIMYAKIIEGQENFVPNGNTKTASIMENSNTMMTAKVSKADFLAATRDGAAIDTRDKKAMKAETKSLEKNVGLGDSSSSQKREVTPIAPGSSDTVGRTDISEQLKLLQNMKGSEKSTPTIPTEATSPISSLLGVQSANAAEIGDSSEIMTSKGEPYGGIETPKKRYNKYGKIIQDKGVDMEGPVKLVDNGGNRGARALSSSGPTGPSLAEQLKAYGGPGENKEKYVDKSLKNPLIYKEGVADQLKLYQNLNK